MTSNERLEQWVDKVAGLTRPDRVHWCTGDEAENDALIAEMLDSGTLIKLNQKTHPKCYLHRSDPGDVARVEHLTFVCTSRREDAGPNNNWMDPGEAEAMMVDLFRGCMRGRTMYVIPYCMGPIDSPLSRCGVEVTDSPYVVANMRIMTRMGTEALRRIERDDSFVRGMHSTGELDPERRFIMHFPEKLLIQSYGSGYGGNALLGKKCHALRIASYQARTEGWLAEHMLIMGVENPQGEVTYVAGAFPSACGKTNLAMLIPPEGYEGWKIHTLGDDICWLHPGEDGRLWAINPEAGFFGVAPGTGAETNPNALAMLSHDAIFTNVAETADRQPWWEGKGEGTPVLDWKGEPYDPARGPAAHPNSRFTVALKYVPSYTGEADAPQGVPISAIIFGGRRQQLVPLVMESESWRHGVLMGSAMASETTAAATGDVGVVRRDPMAMKPFCGYNFGDYWRHWLEIGQTVVNPPKIFHVNWFRKDDDGRFMWPGFCENMRVLEWIVGRCHGTASGKDTPLGCMPTRHDINIEGLEVELETMAELMQVDHGAWRQELADIRAYLESYGERLPGEMITELERVDAALQA